jgi:3-hydroxybutyrate dehydrogenase
MDISEPVITRGDILNLEDKHFSRENVCIVTGAASGIGRATAVAAAVNGLTVIALDINEKGGRETCDIAGELGGKVIFIRTDLTEDTQIERAVAEAAKLGTIKFLANVAGLQHIDSIDNFLMEAYDLMQRIMLRAPFYLSKLVISHIKKARMASVHAHICTRNKPVYNITKFGLRALAQSISAEGEGKFRAFTISAGYVKMPLALKQIPDQAKQRGITQEEVVSEVMMGASRVKEMMASIDVGNLFVFGFSRFSTYLVGGDLLFDGGMVLTY